MEKRSVIDRIISEQTDETFQRAKIALIVRVMVISVLAVYCIETAAMLLLDGQHGERSQLHHPARYQLGLHR